MFLFTALLSVEAGMGHSWPLKPALCTNASLEDSRETCARELAQATECLPDIPKHSSVGGIQKVGTQSGLCETVRGERGWKLVI